jgi:hypothetical protein
MLRDVNYTCVLMTVLLSIRSLPIARIASARGFRPLRVPHIRSNPPAIAHHRSNFYFRIRFKYHSRALPKLAASAANAGAFLQTALSEVIRR